MSEQRATWPGAEDVVVRRGIEVPSDAPISVVVMAINADTRTPAAVASLRRQDVPVEIIVVNTGRGSIKPLLGDMLEHCIVVEGDQLRLPGGTRNLGIRVASGPVIAFLAADCEAAPGWARLRLARHDAGSTAVASALRPSPEPGGSVATVSWASYALLHARRAPEYPARKAALYGASYAREVFDRHGLFEENVRIGEDTEFNARIAATSPVAWAPEVISFHAYPRTIGAAWRDFFDRGRDLMAWQRARLRWPTSRALRRAAGSCLVGLRLVSYATGEPGRGLSAAAPLILLLTVAAASGIVAERLAPGGPRAVRRSAAPDARDP